MKSKTDKKIILGFDMDGVVLDHTENKIRLASKFNLNIKKIETPSDIIRNLIPSSIYRRFQIHLNDDPKFRYLCYPMPGAKEALEKIVASGLPYFLISRRKKPVRAVKILKHHGFWPKYFNHSNSYFVLTPEDKNVKAAELGITHYFDDQHTVLDKLVDVKNRILFDSIKAIKNPPYRRISSWKEILKSIF